MRVIFRRASGFVQVAKALGIGGSLTALVFVLALAGCGGDDSEGTSAGGGESRSVRVGYVPVATVLPALVAEDTGIFDRNGLDVSLTPVENVANIPRALGRQFDVGSVTPPDLINAAEQGIRVGAVTASTVDTTKNSVGEIIVPADSAIRSVKDLAGKRVATPSVGAAMHVSLLNWLSEEGGDIDAITAVETPFPTMADQLKAGQVDAVESVQPFVNLMLEQGDRSLGSPILSVGEEPVLSVLWISQTSWAEENPEAVERWNKSLSEAETLIQRDEPRARRILLKFTELPPEVARTVTLPNFDASLGQAELEAGIGSWIDAVRNAGQLEGDVNVEELVAKGGGGP